ncbi:MAG: PEP-CTERM sorting domain-containing protein [Verrucomicrobiota bacterium]
MTWSGVLVINGGAEEKLEKQSQLQTLMLMKKNYLLTGLIASTVVLFASNALADSAVDIEGYTSGAVATYDNASGAYPVITAILSAPVGTLDGYTYTKYAMFAADGTGSIDVYGALPSGTSFTPAVGDAISASGTWSPYDQIPEIETLTSLTLFSAGNAVSSPNAYTISQLTASTTIPLTIAGYLVTLDNVSLYTDSAATIPVSGNFATHANVTLYAKDGSGNIMEVYDWASSYSVDGALGGTAIPTGLVDITGFVDQSGTYPVEFVPMSITAVPEPATLGLCGAGGLLALIFRLRRKA